MSNINLKIKDIHFKYDCNDDWQIQINELNFEPGIMTCVVGPNGSGKSTLLRIAAGILTPHKGTVTINNKNLVNIPRRTIAKTMGYLPQESPALYDYTISDVVEMGRYTHQQGFITISNKDKEIVNKALEIVNLERYSQRILSNLSGGEQRRALIASVLAQQPDLMLLDEPTSGLDIHHASSIFKLLLSLTKKGIGTVVVTHDINLASLFCDRIIIIKNGHIKAMGNPCETITPKIMQLLYGPEILVQQHPETKRPIILPSILHHNK